MFDTDYSQLENQSDGTVNRLVFEILGTGGEHSQDPDFCKVSTNWSGSLSMGNGFSYDSTVQPFNTYTESMTQAKATPNLQLDDHATERTQIPRRATPWEKRKTRCPLCGIHLLKKTLQRHIRSTHSTQARSIECDICKATFKRQDILDRHVGEQHKQTGHGAGSIECMYCGQLVHERALKDHFKSRKCVVARRSPAQEGRALSDSATYYGTIDLLLIEQLGLDFAIDAETACYFSLAILWTIPTSISPTWLLRYRELITHFWAFRAVEIRSLRREMDANRASARGNSLVLSLYFLDFCAFGESRTVQKHIQYLRSQGARDWGQAWLSFGSDENKTMQGVMEAKQRVIPSKDPEEKGLSEFIGSMFSALVCLEFITIPKDTMAKYRGKFIDPAIGIMQLNHEVEKNKRT